MILNLRALFKKEISAEGCGHFPCVDHLKICHRQAEART